MSKQPRALRPLLALAASTLSVGAIGVSNAHAVILYKTATKNTSAPTGALADSGWQYAGLFGGFMGTAVAPHYFITAQHIGGPAPFVLNGVTYTIDSSFNVSGPGYASEPGTDLRLWKVTQAMPIYAPLFHAAVDGSEVGRPMVVMGRGTERGAPVYGESSSNDSSSSPRGGSGEVGGPSSRGGELKGWRWGADTQIKSWGTNIVSSIVDGGDKIGNVLAFDFDRDGSSDEGALSSGDSGGPVFIQSNGTWKLAGVNFGTDGPWRYADPSSTDTNGGQDTLFQASLFDAGGMKVLADAQGNFYSVPESSQDVPASSYSSSISSNYDWIHQYLALPGAKAVPEPSVIGIVTLSALGALRRRRHRG